MKEMTPDQVRTAWGMLAILVLIFLADGWLNLYCGQEATFSSTARALSQKWPAFPIMVSIGAGLLLGHVFL